MVEHTEPASPLRIAMIGTRGVPAAYGGFETAVEEIGSRLAARGHEVTVYCRRAADASRREYAGMHLVHLPALKLKTAETLSHTAFSVAHAIAQRPRPDVAFVFNAANAPFVTLLRARGIPAAVHVDGLEWQREKWGGAGRAYYRWAEQIGRAECRCAHRRCTRHRRPLRVLVRGADPADLVRRSRPVEPDRAIASASWDCHGRDSTWSSPDSSRRTTST